MLNHIVIGSNDIEKTKAFYNAVLGVLGAGDPIEHVNDTGQTRLFTFTTAPLLASANLLMVSL